MAANGQYSVMVGPADAIKSVDGSRLSLLGLWLLTSAPRKTQEPAVMWILACRGAGKRWWHAAFVDPKMGVTITSLVPLHAFVVASLLDIRIVKVSAESFSPLGLEPILGHRSLRFDRWGQPFSASAFKAKPTCTVPA